MKHYEILNSLDEGVQIVSPDMKYIFLNKSLLKEINLSAEEVFGKAMNEKFPGIDQTEIYKEIKNCIADGKSRNVVNEFYFPDGRQTFHELNIQRVPEGAILFSRDITPSKKGEILLRETNKELEKFAYISAHSLREPLKQILTYTDLFLNDYDQSLNDEQKQILKLIFSKSEWALQFVDGLRALSGIGDRKLVRSRCDIGQIVSEVVQSLQAATKTQIDFKGLDQEIHVSSYQSLVALLFRCLLLNALQHGLGEIHLSVSAALDSDQKIFCLSNKAALNAHFYDPFVAQTVDVSSVSRHGLGAMICRRIIDKHGGRIWAEQKADRFYVYFSLS